MIRKAASVVIPSTARRKQPRDFDRHLYEARHLIENLFARLKQYRGGRITARAALETGEALPLVPVLLKASDYALSMAQLVMIKEHFLGAIYIIR